MIWDSSVLILTIFSYVAFFSFVGYFTFRTTLEGYIYFQTPSLSCFYMFVLLTTANFPDVMLPAYNANRWFCLYFIGYLCMGLYFLQNVLLATVQYNYQRRIQKKVEQGTETRAQYIEAYFDKFDEDKKGHLTLPEAKEFFALVLDLNFRKSKDRATFRKIMKLVDIENNRIVHKPEVMQFFSMSNFLEVIVNQPEAAVLPNATLQQETAR
jgi:two pore calcium channel protein, plant